MGLTAERHKIVGRHRGHVDRVRTHFAPSDGAFEAMQAQPTLKFGSEAVTATAPLPARTQARPRPRASRKREHRQGSLGWPRRHGL